MTPSRVSALCIVQWGQIRLDTWSCAILYQYHWGKWGWEVSDCICKDVFPTAKSVMRLPNFSAPFRFCNPWIPALCFYWTLQEWKIKQNKGKQTKAKKKYFFFLIFLIVFSLQEWNFFRKELLEHNHPNFSSLFAQVEQQCDWSEEWDCNLPGLTTRESSAISSSPFCSFPAVQSFTYFISLLILTSCQENPKRRLGCQASNFKCVLEGDFWRTVQVT